MTRDKLVDTVNTLLCDISYIYNAYIYTYFLLQAIVKYRNEPKQVMTKSEDLSRSLEINAIGTFDTDFPTIFIKSCTFVTFIS